MEYYTRISHQLQCVKCQTILLFFTSHLSKITKQINNPPTIPIKPCGDVIAIPTNSNNISVFIFIGKYYRN